MPYATPTRKQLYDRQRYADNKERLNQQQKDYYQKNREERLAYIRAYSKKRVQENCKLVWKLKENPCMDCGNQFHVAAMDFDHRPDEIKVENISVLMRSQRTSRKNLLAEIAKCDLVCSNCHRVRTFERMSNEPN